MLISGPPDCGTGSVVVEEDDSEEEAAARMQQVFAMPDKLAKQQYYLYKSGKRVFLNGQPSMVKVESSMASVYW